MKGHQVHATGCVVGTTGLLLLGPAGSGKSSMALKLLFEASLAGHFSALIGDDQLYLTSHEGQIIAAAPDSISGLLEIRGTGIGRLATIAKAPLDWAIELVEARSASRLPDPIRWWEPAPGLRLPLLSLDRQSPAPFAALAALIDGFPVVDFTRQGHRALGQSQL